MGNVRTNSKAESFDSIKLNRIQISDSGNIIILSELIRKGYVGLTGESNDTMVCVKPFGLEITEQIRSTYGNENTLSCYLNGVKQSRDSDFVYRMEVTPKDTLKLMCYSTSTGAYFYLVKG